MGGYGSGRRLCGFTKVTVEDSLAISAYYMQKHHLFKPFYYGSLTWKYQNGVKSASVSFEIDRYGETLILKYTKTKHQETVCIENNIQLTQGPVGFGCIRYYFLCPNCGRRYSKLYLPPGATRFACRKCYDLTYTSCQESHKFDGLFRDIGNDVGMSPEEVKRILRERFK